MAHGALTAKLARQIADDWAERGYTVLYDHGSPGENVGKIVSWLGKAHRRESQLSQIDIAIVEKDSDQVFALIEIEETNDKPKTLLGDALGVLMGEHLSFAGKCELSVGQGTVLVILGKSKIPHKERNEHLRKQVMDVKSSLSTANAEIGSVVIETFSDDGGLFALLPSVLNQTFKRELDKLWKK
jgi:hypothetical protein